MVAAVVSVYTVIAKSPFALVADIAGPEVIVGKAPASVTEVAFSQTGCGI
jgi:hypothetical protein